MEIQIKGNLSTKLVFPQKDENALTTLLHSANDMAFAEADQIKHQTV